MGIRAVSMACAWAVMSLVVPRPGFCAPPQQVEGQAVAPQNPGAAKNDSAKIDSKVNAHASPADAGNGQIPEPTLRLRDVGRNFLQDQKQIWTSPMRVRFSDTEWLVPFAGITAGLITTDQDVSSDLSHDPKTTSHYNTISNAGIGALVGGTAGLWLLSYPAHNDHWRETGLLAGQAALNSLVAI